MINFSKYINPIFRSLDNIVEFDNIVNSPFITEYPYLMHLIKLINVNAKEYSGQVERLQKEIIEILFLVESNTGDDKSEAIADYNRTFKIAERVVEDLNRLLDQLSSPYFGRITFDRKAGKDIPAGKITSYIGKYAYFDQETKKALITDWRAPIANLYYMNPGPQKNVDFESPAGLQTGDLVEKTQFDIAMGRISNVYSAQTGNSTADAFLLSQLNKKVGKKLTDIVSTIQDQQNTIIREGIMNPMIIQGVAGSGKTTILLHRIAYLLYKYKSEISTENSLIIAPSKMFLDYISEILPSLGVGHMLRNTYLFWAKTILKWDSNYVFSSEPDDLDVKTFKGSKVFIDIIEKFFVDFESDLFDKINDPIKDKIEARYYELGKIHPNLPMNERLELAVSYSFAQLQYVSQTTGNFMGKLDRNNLRQKLIQDYIKNRTSPFKLYKELFRFEYIFRDFKVDPTLIAKVREYSLKTITTSKNISYYKFEDLAPLVWMTFKIQGTDVNMRDYIAIDEAQDMSLFQLLTLHKIAKNGNITIAGDLAQSIIEPFYLTDWKQVIDLYKEHFNTETQYHHLDKCYRTTIEVIEFANRIITGKFPESYKLPEAVLRHGDKVNIHEYNLELSSDKFTQNENDKSKLIELIKEERTKGFATLAIVCRNSNHADKIFNNLNVIKDEFDENVFNYSEEDYHEGILVLPIERAKGLEFDSVIIADMNEENYPKSFLNAKLFYVAATRALHRLHVVTSKSKKNSTLLN
jgi:DNA helicase-2/ATP-dependent DNA helicase PcrA